MAHVIAIPRLIPAHAGKTDNDIPQVALRSAHPRSRGENHLPGFADADDWGSSPLTRGKRDNDVSGRRQPRLIPAHAGKTLPDLRFYCADRSDLGNP